jgi:hypothetical protein
MKRKFIKYISITISTLILVIIYLSIFGIETEKFNKQIADKISQTNSNLDLKFKKIKLTLDLLNFKINAKTIGAKILYQKKNLDLEYIKTQISLISIFKNKITSSNLEISTKSILLKDLVSFARTTTNRTELFFLERMISNGYVILDVNLNFDENGNIKNDYEIRGILRDGKINFFKKYNFEEINFLLSVKNNIFNFKDIRFTTNKINFLSDSLKVTKNKKDFIFEGVIENKNSTLNNIQHDLKKLNFQNIIFSSKNDFSFKVDNKFKLKNLVITSEIEIDEFEYKKPDFVSEYFPKVENIIFMKDHKIKVIFKKDNYFVKGLGKVKLQKEYDEIEYVINSKNKDFNSNFKIALSELSLKSQEFLKNFLPNINDVIILKKHQVEINYNNDDLLFRGLGKIKLEKEFEKINYSISKSGNKFNFNTKLDLNKMLLKIDYLNLKKDKNLNAELVVEGIYEKDKGLNLKKVSILDNDIKIILNNFLLDKENKIIKVDKIDLDYVDAANKKNEFSIQRKQKNDYELKGVVFNANSIIADLLKNKNDDEKSDNFKNDINLYINLAEIFIDDVTVARNLKGKLRLENNKIVQTNISALFKDNENFTFTINTKNDEKTTTLFSSRAKPLVRQYKFIKGFEEGYLDFYSSKKGNVSQSTLKIYDFKLQELPILTKLLTLASLQGIADILSGEGIRFDQFEMNFNNKGNSMTIDEIYAIGPAISILMNGYVEPDKLISLRGTLVPATTINKTISSIPILGKILVGDKTGEGVFGVSFKIKGPPKSLETTVNPIKTLTPRFITRTLEKINKN